MTFTDDVFSQLTSFVNKNSLENGCNLPDFVIARHLEAAYFSLCNTLKDMAEYFDVPEGWSGAPAWSENLKDRADRLNDIDWKEAMANAPGVQEFDPLNHVYPIPAIWAPIVEGTITFIEGNKTAVYNAADIVTAGIPITDSLRLSDLKGKVDEVALKVEPIKEYVAKAEDWEDLAEGSALTHMTETEDTDAEVLLGEVPIISVNHTDPHAVTVVGGRLNIGGKATAEQIKKGLEELGLQEVANKIANADCSGSCCNGIEDDTHTPGLGV